MNRYSLPNSIALSFFTRQTHLRLTFELFHYKENY